MVKRSRQIKFTVMSKFLFEDQVVDAVRNYLKDLGFVEEAFCHADQKGDDIVYRTENGKERIYIEAKDATSSRNNSNRYGKPFSKSQVKTHVAMALYRAILMKEKRDGEKVLVGIALPKTDLHVNIVAKIQETLSKLSIELFWVTIDNSVEIEGHW